jgi:hypothetical protein
LDEKKRDEKNSYVNSRLWVRLEAMDYTEPKNSGGSGTVI